MNNFHEFAMELLLWKKGTSAHDHALLVVGNDLRFAACARADLGARPGTGTAVINVLQSAIDAGVNVKSAWIYTTSGVGWGCAGMARLQTRGGHIFYPGEHGVLKCYCADRTNFGPVAPEKRGWGWSNKADHWSQLGRGATLRNTWFQAIKGKTWFRAKYVPVVNLQANCSAAAAAVESLAVSTGRAATTLTKFFEPGAAGAFDIVNELKTPAEKDAFFSLLAQELVYRLRGRTDDKVDPAQVGHNIGSVMVDAAYRVVGWAVNTNHLNGTFHGETNLVQAHEAHGKPTLPKGGAMYTTLEPCEMCAGVIRSAVAGDDKAFRVQYIQPDRTLAQTALTREDSPVKMGASPAASEGVGLGKGVRFGQELSRRQDVLARDTHESYKAPTKFLRHDRALDVFRIAGQQRLGMSDAPALSGARTSVRQEGNLAAALDQRALRQELQRGFNTPRPVSEIKKYGNMPSGARDDLALLPLRRAPLQHAPLQHGLSRDDFYVGWQPPRRVVDPVLVQLAAELDKLSEKFREVFDDWFATHGTSRTNAEKARLLKQVTDFLDRARTACMT
jgi:deoxycytidylate deaminase